MTHDGTLVFLSFVVAVIASYAALHIGTRLRMARGKARSLCLAGGSVVLGGGISSTNFIGILGSNPGVPADYDITLTAGSLLVAIVIVAVGLHIVTVPRPSVRRFAAAGCIVGTGIATMHYTGMSGLILAGIVGYDPPRAAISCAVAIVAATASLLLASNPTNAWQRVVAATTMAITISGMLYTGMSAISIAVAPGTVALTQAVASEQRSHIVLAGAISIELLIILCFASVCAIFDRRFQVNAEQQAETHERLTQAVANEARLRAAAETASEWVWETDATLRLTFVSKRFADTSGIGWTDVSGLAFGDLVTLGFDPPGMAGLLATMAVRGSFNAVVYPVVLATGTTRFWRLNGAPWVDPATGVFAGYRGSGTDVTARIQRETDLTNALQRAEAAEQQARHDRATLLDAIEAIAEGFVLHDANDRLVLCNARYAEMYSLVPEATLPGAHFEDALMATAAARQQDADAPGFRDEVRQRLIRHRAPAGNREEHRLPDGRWVAVEERRTSDGGTVGIRIDMTEAHQRMIADREHARALGELKAARLIQTNLLPSPRLLHDITVTSGLDIASRSASCSELGGDLWGIRGLGDRRAGVYTVDFAGHGTAAALNTFRLHTLMHELSAELNDPAGLLRALNVRLTELLSRGTFATMFYAVLDPCRGCISYASAGAPSPMVRCGKDLPLICLDGSGVPLGISATAEYTSSTVDFAPGGALFLYSDVFTDGLDGSGKRIGEEGIFAQAQACAEETTAEAFVKRICAPFLESPAVALADDLTAVCIMQRYPVSSGT